MQNILIKGSVIDIDTRQPLEYATISLANNDNPDQIQGVITDKISFFNIKVPSGLIVLKVEFIGFDTF